MTPERWREIERLYHATLAHAEDRRVAFLADACAGDAPLQREVESLLAHESAAAGFMSTPAMMAGAMASSAGVLTGRHLGPYAICARIGVGGMGEVYKGRDTRLSRDVAIKVLAAQVAADPQSLERFQREARAVASLNHPHICTLHDVGSQDGTDFLVMEYLDGETLAERLERGLLRLDQALQYAVQIADALDKAHRLGITHRDLKPANVMIVKSGAKLLDFGLAKLQSTATGAVVEGASDSRLTAPGMMFGTLQYMAPEQIKGKKTDARTDLFAFGAVLYQMLTGARAFQGDGDADVMVAILERDPPPVSSQQPLATPALDRIVSTCLAKDPDDRWQTARDLLRELTWVADTKAPEEATRAHVHRQPRLALAATAVVAALLGGGVIGWTLTKATVSGIKQVTRVSLNVAIAERVGEQSPPPVRPGRSAFALSPDGRTLVFSRATGAATQLFVRPLDRTTARPRRRSPALTAPTGHSFRPTGSGSASGPMAS
jgi:eukaryotic-like serine/threonine-protein kinase